MDSDMSESRGEYACNQCGGVFRIEHGRYVTPSGIFCPDCYPAGPWNMAGGESANDPGREVGTESAAC